MAEMKISSTMVNDAENGTIAYARQIKDEALDKFQTEINSDLQNNIDAEIQRATAAEQDLQDAINAEIRNSTAADGILREAIESLQSDVESNYVKEVDMPGVVNPGGNKPGLVTPTDKQHLDELWQNRGEYDSILSYDTRDDFPSAGDAEHLYYDRFNAYLYLWNVDSAAFVRIPDAHVTDALRAEVLKAGLLAVELNQTTGVLTAVTNSAPASISDDSRINPTTGEVELVFNF